MNFADVKNDIAFRKIFGNAAKTEILLSFLNAVLQLEGGRELTWVEILTPYQLPIVVGAKASILDVKARDRSGNEYIIEMQMTDKLGFAQRVVYYSAKSYSSQLETGEEYYKLKPTIFIGILNFTFLQSVHYISRHLILDSETYEHKLKDLEFNFIELPKFEKSEGELVSNIDKWVYFIKNAENLTVMPENISDQGLTKAYLEADRHSWSKAEVEAYQYARLRESDDIAEKMLVELNAKKQIAQKAIAKGLDTEIIMELTGLTLEEIEQLRTTE
jgi:predicted transposase/invertase (TIGR01784 family)